jgi:hypothetical protein
VDEEDRRAIPVSPGAQHLAAGADLERLAAVQELAPAAAGVRSQEEPSAGAGGEGRRDLPERGEGHADG